MLRGGFFPFRHFGHILKNTVFEKATQNDKNGNGKISPYRAFCIGLGGAVGMGNISGVATSVAVGGPGAIFWMLVWAFFGMMLKMAEISLGLYYRRKDSNGKYVGSAMDYMERGIKGEQGKKIGGPLSVLFAIGLFMQFTQGSGSYTVAETLNASFGFNIMAVGIIYTAFVLFLIIRGENAIGRMAEKIVPVMCAIYLLGTVVIILMNITNVPSMLVGIFQGAFSGTAAVGGFAGAAVSLAIQQMCIRDRGGLHTTLSHPVTSSHMGVPDDVRRKMGITPGMIRVSVGIEDVGDLIADFENALRVFD